MTITSTETYGGEPVTVYIWPDGMWCAEEGVLEEMLQYRSDDYMTVQVTEWEEDGSPAARYFV